MAPRENNLDSLREVHERMRLYTVSQRDSRWIHWVRKQARNAGKMLFCSLRAHQHEPAVPRPPQGNVNRIEWMARRKDLEVVGATGRSAWPTNRKPGWSVTEKREAVRATSRPWRDPTSLSLFGCRGSDRCDTRCARTHAQCAKHSF